MQLYLDFWNRSSSLWPPATSSGTVTPGRSISVFAVMCSCACSIASIMELEGFSSPIHQVREMSMQIP